MSKFPFTRLPDLFIRKTRIIMKIYLECVIQGLKFIKMNNFPSLEILHHNFVSSMGWEVSEFNPHFPYTHMRMSSFHSCVSNVERYHQQNQATMKMEGKPHQIPNILSISFFFFLLPSTSILFVIMCKSQLERYWLFYHMTRFRCRAVTCERNKQHNLIAICSHY